MAAESSAPSATAVALVFSKDRAWQLQQTISSLRQFCVGLSGVHVIFTASSDSHKAAYAKQFELHDEFVHMHNEAQLGFKGTLMSVTQNIATNHQFTILAVDDLIFINSVPVQSLCQAFKNSRLWCIHLKLDPCKEYCHPADTVCVIPKLTTRRHITAAPFVTWALSSRGTHDWCYPWDLCATLYRSTDLLSVLTHLEDANPVALEHPNTLEAEGNTLLRSGGGSALLPPDALLGALQAPAAACITVNRVQDVYSNAVFDATGEDSSPDALVSWAGTPRAYDWAWYRRHAFSSVHIGHLCCQQEAQQSAQPIRVDVVMPMFNAARTVRSALASLLAAQPLHDGHAPPLDLHIVLVDDGSTDGSWDAAMQELNHKYVNDEKGNACSSLPAAVAALAETATHGMLSSELSWTAVKCSSNGRIARALNVALACTRPDAAYIARMDADDVAMPGRLQKQVAFMRANALQLCGSSAVLFTSAALVDHEEGHDVASTCIAPIPGDYPLSRPACHPVLLAWDMLWGCALLHPTTMATAQWWRGADESGALHVDGASSLPAVYRTEAVPAEDYDLWLRHGHLPSTAGSPAPSGAAGSKGGTAAAESETPPLPSLVANIGTPLLWYRKGGLGGVQAELQRSQAAAARLAAWNRLLGAEHAIDNDSLGLIIGRGDVQGVPLRTVLAAGAALVRVHDAFLQAVGLGTPQPGSIAQQAAAAPSFSAVSASALRRHVFSEVQRRLSALAMAAMAAQGPAAMPLLAQWRAFKARSSKSE